MCLVPAVLLRLQCSGTAVGIAPSSFCCESDLPNQSILASTRSPSNLRWTTCRCRNEKPLRVQCARVFWSANGWNSCFQSTAWHRQRAQAYQFLPYLLLYLITTSHLCTHVTNTSKMLGSHTKQTAELSTFMLPEVTDTHSSSFSPLFISVYIPFYLSSCPSAHHLPIYLPIYVSSHPSSFISVCLSPCASF